MRATTTMLPLWFADCRRRRVGLQRYGGCRAQPGEVGSAGTARLPHITRAEREEERLSKLGAERGVQDEVDCAVDDDEQVAEVSADRQLQLTGGGHRARRGNQVDGVELLDGLRQLAD